MNNKGNQQLYDAKNMEVSISTTFNYDIPLSSMAPMIKNAGFDWISLSGSDYAQLAYLTVAGRDEIISICSENNLLVDSIHAPLGDNIDISHTDSDVREYGVHLFKQAIHACTEIGCSMLVIHLCNRFPDDEFGGRMVAVRDSLEEIIPYARHKNITIAIENLIKSSTLQLFERVLAEHNVTGVGVCLDTSHANIVGNLYSLLEKYGDRIIATHISDNKGLLDDHMLPFEGTLDWNKFTQHFAKIPYKEKFLLEVEMRESSFKEPQVFLKEAYRRAQALITQLDTHRGKRRAR